MAPPTAASLRPVALKPSTSAPLAHKIKLPDAADAHGPVPLVVLRKFRFLLLAVLGGVATAGGLAFFLHGITIEHGIHDAVGSSANADQRVELFQTLNGFLWAVVGLLLEKYFEIVIAVMLLYFVNCPWYPGDDVTHGPTTTKRRMLFWFTPLMMYIVNVGLSSVFVEQRADEILHAFADDDLANQRVQAATTLARLPGNTTSVLDTVLRKLVTNRAMPFQVNTTSNCSTFASKTAKPLANNESVIIPSMMDLQSTSVSYGLPPRPWNLDAMPTSLTPTHSVTLDQKNASESKIMQKRLDAFMVQSGVTYKMISELLIQGLTLHGKAATDSNLFEDYSCDPQYGMIEKEEVDETMEGPAKRARRLARARSRAGKRAHTEARRRRRLSEIEHDADGESEESEEEETVDETFFGESVHLVNGMTYDDDGVGVCFGIDNYLIDMVDFSKKAHRSYASIFDSVYAFGGINHTNIVATLETYELSPQLNMTTLTLDVPYDDFAEYCYVDSDVCDTETATYLDPETEREKFETEAEFLAQQAYDCWGRYVPIDDPYEMCGERNCVLEDYSAVVFTNKQIQLTPYMANCQIGRGNVTYDPELAAWFPSNCSAQNNSAFLYGVGSYFEGDFSLRGGGDIGPEITNTRRHWVVTFAKLDWRFDRLNERLDAKCDKDAGGCQGLLHGLQNVEPGSNGSRVLVVGEQSIPKSFQHRTLRNPLTLVALREPKLYNQYTRYTYYMYEYLDIARLNTTYKESNGLGLDAGQCSLYLDAYLDQIKNNHYIIQDPRQPLYTSALYYLLQDAQVKEITLPANASTVISCSIRRTQGEKNVCRQITFGCSFTRRVVCVLDLSARVVGTTRMKGDHEYKAIRLSIPLVSALSTCTGIAMLLVYMAVIIKWPRDAVKLSDEANPAAKYVDMLTEEYPEHVHTRTLRFSDGATAAMDEFVPERIVFRNIHDLDRPVVME